VEATVAKKVKTYKMWALFNYDRPPIFVDLTRREVVVQGTNWLGEHGFKRQRRNGSVTIEKVVVRRVERTTEGKNGR
jgi:hypothetical protein